ncbi:MAG: PTS sugar transporter subunit IIC [Proteobacteria bacterium]|nr:PTS sugar transporter subunit IIC [Pseudomonadota bacterium]
MWSELILVSLIGGLICLDRTAAFQLMISRPLVTGPLIGLFLGQPVIGLVVGLLLELIWIGRPPLGGYIPPNECLAAVLITAGAILSGRIIGHDSRSLIVLAFLLALPLARLATFLEGGLRRANVMLARRAELAVSAGRYRQIPGLNMAGLGFAFLHGTVFLLLSLPVVVVVLSRLYPVLTPPLLRACELMFLFLPLIGIASALSNVNVKRSEKIFGLVFLLALALLSR